MRRYGKPRRAGVKYKTRPGAYGIIAQGRDLLLTHQVLETSEIQLPGGGIDPGETPIRALHREVFEETGYRIVVHKRLGAYQKFTYMPEYDLWAHKICHIFLCRPTLRVCDPLEANHSVLWMDAFDAQSALENTGDAAFVSHLFGMC